MIFSNFSKKERILLFITISLGFVFLIYNLLIRSIILNIDKLNTKILTNEMKLKKNSKILSQKEKIQAEYVKYSELLRQKNSDEQEMATLLSEIEAVAREVAIHITNMKPHPIKVIDFYKRLAVDVEVEARLSEITKFVYNLQNQPHLLRVERLHLEGRAGRSSSLKGYLLVNKDIIP